MKNFEGVTDEALALLYVQGNNRAFDELLNRSQTKLFTYIMFVVHDHDVADDIFQDTFVKAITKLQQGQYTDSGKFQFWLTRIAHNCIMDWSAITPSLTTRIRSALRMVERRWAMTMLVRPSIRTSSAS